MSEDIEVAVIEQDPDLQRLFRDILADAGCNVTLFADHDAIPSSWVGRIVVCDSGGIAYERREVVRRIRSLKERTGAKVVVVSAHAEVQRDAEHLGADGILGKPFHVDELLAVVRALAA